MLRSWRWSPKLSLLLILGILCTTVPLNMLRLPDLPARAAQYNACDLYPIALASTTVANIAPGTVLTDIYNGSQAGNFGWLSWAGSPSEHSLATSLTAPGDVDTYVNPNNPTDHILGPGDWAHGKPGVSNSSEVRAALDALEAVDIAIPVWDSASGNGNNTLYHISAFARVRLLSYQLPQQNRISARYLGSVTCGEIVHTPTPTPSPTPTPTPTPSPFSGATLTLSPGAAGPNVTGTSQTLQATLLDHNGNPLVGFSIQFAVTGPNATTGSGTSSTAGVAAFTYTGASSGTDAVQATATLGGQQLPSNVANVGWVTPVQPVSTTTVWSRFFTSDGSGIFNTPATQPPAFTQVFPTIDFNPPEGTIPGNTSGVGVFTRPFTDITTDVNGNFTGAIIAQGNGYQAGNGALFAFNAAFSGKFTVAAAGDTTFNFFSDDGFILGVGDGATRVGGPLVNPPPSGLTTFGNLPVMGSYNQPTSPVANSITVHFPAPGTYTYELDYSECCGGQLALTMATAASGSHGVPPTGALTISPNSVAAQPAGATQTFTVTAIDAAGGALPNLPVALGVNGPNSQELHATTDAGGHATFTYTGSAPGTDNVQAVAWVSGIPIYSALIAVPWSVPPSPPPSPPVTSPGWLGGPANQSVVSGTVPIVLGAGVTLQQGVVDYWPADNPSAVTVVTSSAQGGPGATVASLDTTVLANQSYIIRLQGTDNTGAQLVSEILVTVAGENKPGRLKFSVTDLTVPVTGLPVTIGRTYDSLERGHGGDFGNGWSLSVGSPRLEVNPAHDVTLTGPDGRRVTFTFTPYAQSWVFGFLLTPAYTAEPGFYGSLTANSCGLVVATGNGYVCFLDSDYQPTSYTYTDPYGRVYTMSPSGSLQTVRDVAGNTLTFSPAGITSSAGGINVPFARDGQGRITSITDPNGNVYHYTYDAAGNLVTVGLPGVATPMRYTYDSSHLILSAIDPRGNTAASTSYYPDGRLQTATDAAGNTTHYVYDVPNHITTVTNPDGGVTASQYDGYGSVIRQTDPLSRTTTFAYDANHNLLVQTDGLGHSTNYSYDSKGNRTAITDALGKTTSATYNQYGNPLSLTDPLNNSWSIATDSNSFPVGITDALGTLGGYTWDTKGNPLTRVDGNGKVTTFTYDIYGNKLSETDPLGHPSHYTYDSLGRMLTAADALSDTTTYSYDALGRRTTMIDALGQVTHYEYDGNGNKTAEVNPANQRTTYTYDSANRLTGVGYPDGTSRSYTYDFRDNRVTETDQAGHVAHYQYDLAGQLLAVTTAEGTPDASTIRYTYDAAGRKLSDVDPLGHVTTYAYDDAGHLLSMTDPLGHATTYAYDDAGRRIASTDPDGHQTHYAFDIRGRLTITTYADGTTSRQSYDGAGNVVNVTDQARLATTYGYDDARRLVAVTDALSATTTYRYDPTGQLLAVIDGNNHQTSYAYDGLNRRTAKIWPDGSRESYGYDAVGNRTSQQLADSQTNTFSYDSLNRQTRASFADGRIVSYAYTPTGARQAVTDTRGTTRYVYDQQIRPVSITPPSGQTVAYTYDVAGNRLTLTTPAGTTHYGYDAVNRLATVTDPQGGASQYTYDNAGLRTQLTLPNGVAVDYGYDTLNRLTSLVQHHGAQQPFASYTYTLGPAGTRLGVTEADGSTVQWTYDNAYRLTGETRRDPANAVTAQATYAYDAVGNRLSATTNGQTTRYTYNALDEVVSAGAAQYHYDSRGNLLQITSGAASTSFRYDTSDRLAGATPAGGTPLSYVYDADGRRVQQTAGTAVTNYLWDELSPNGDVVLETAGNGATQASYVLGGSTRACGTSACSGCGGSTACGSGAELISQTRGGAVSYYLHDAQGSTRTLTDSAGAVTDRYTYDAFGGIQARSGTTVNTYQFGGQQLDAATGLYDLRARYYDPAAGRFLTRDTFPVLLTNPVELDRYSYARDNPVNYGDPTGLSAGAIALPRPAVGGGAIGEYAALLFIAIIVAPAVAELGRAIQCIFIKVATLLMGLSGMPTSNLPWRRECQFPVCEFPASRMPAVAQHMQDAINAGYPRLLTYNGPNSPQTDLNRAAACGSFVRTTPGGSCDEYPLASSAQGGAGSSTREVPLRENNAQGGFMSACVRRFGLGPGSPFAVVIVP